MIEGRLARLGLGLTAAVTFGVMGVAGCGADGDGGGGTATKDPKTELREAVDKLGETSAKFDLSAGPLTGSGVVDAPNKQGNVKMQVSAEGETLNVEVLMIANDMWLKMTGVPNMPEKWLHIDPAKLSESSGLGIRPGEMDVVGGDKLLNGISTVEETSDGQYEGTLDLTKASGSSFADDATVKELGERAKSVPFEATVDDEGRLTKLTMDMGQISGQSMKLDANYSDFGADVKLEAPPAGEVTEAPAEIYQFLNA